MRIFLKLSLIVITTLFVTVVKGQNVISKVTSPSKPIIQYKKSEWKITIRTTFQNPYLQEDVALDMEMISPSGKALTLPCYFVSGESGSTTIWKARFTPQEKGLYTYAFQLKKQGALPEASKKSSFIVKSSKGSGFLHGKNDWTFQFDNGESFRGIGLNLGWESRIEDDSKFFKALHEKPKYNYDYMLRSLSSHGGNYFRTWICSWNLPLDWKSGINNARYTNTADYYNPGALQRMDHMINLSDSLGLYVMLTLGPGTYDEKNGRYHTSTREFFVDPKAKAQYKNRLRFIVARWGYSPAIGAWEFFNEIDNVQFRDKDNPISAESIVLWHEEMSSYLKKIDPYEHLVTTSISHRDLEGLNSIRDIDFNQKHIYKDNRALPTTVVKYAAEFKKPYVIGEYGYEYDWSKNFNLFADEMDSDFKRGLWYGLFSPTPILPLSWWWEFFDDRGTDAYISRVRTIQDLMMASGKGSFEKAGASASLSEIEVYSVKCGDETYVYAYNPSKESKMTDLSFSVTGKASKRIKVYDCESGIFQTLKGKVLANNAQLKRFNFKAGADFVFIISK